MFTINWGFVKMVSICFYFQVHQPYRLRDYTVFDIGKNHDYFDHKKNKDILNKVANKCYLPTNKLMLDLLKKHPEFRVSYSFSGVVLDQFEEYNKEVLESFQKLVDTGQVEVLDETYHHSLSYLYSKEEFKEQVRLHRNKIKKLFGVTPKVFRNTELIYNNELAKYIEDMGYKGILAEGADHILGWRSPNFLYRPKTTSKIKLLLKNYKLSDDIAFRFSNKGWKEHPLTTEKFTQWINAVNGNGNCINLFMDYETFGEHQWEDTGIFEFLRHLPREILKHPDNNFKTPSELIKSYEPVSELDVHHLISWADVERDLSAWLGNKMQDSAIGHIYQLEKDIKKTKDKQLLEEWRKMQTSDNYYYMCTKWFNDGDVHKYFNPYDSPYDSFIGFMNALNDLRIRLSRINAQIKKTVASPIIE
jgi:alpha-amylase